jgi:hypothetical protein
LGKLEKERVAEAGDKAAQLHIARCQILQILPDVPPSQMRGEVRQLSGLAGISRFVPQRRPFGTRRYPNVRLGA